MAHWNNGFFHGLIVILDKILLTENGYNVSKVNVSPTKTQVLGDTRINSQMVGKNVDIKCGENDADYVTINGQIAINPIDKRIAGTSAPTTVNAKEGQLYFRIID